MLTGMTIWVMAMAAQGCGGASEPTPKQPAPAATKCPQRSGDGGQAAFDEARALDAAVTDDYDSKSRAQRFKLYAQAAKAGHLEAQFVYGWRMFESLYMGDPPVPSERATYVAAMTDIFGSGFRGLEKARTDFPNLLEMIDTHKLPSELEQPLDELPREWVQEALDAALACYPPAPAEK